MADNNDNKQTLKNSKGTGGSDRPDDNFDWSKIIRMVFGWGAVIVAFVIILQLFKTIPQIM